MDAFLDKGPEALTFLHEAGKIPFTTQADRPDYHPDVPGASHGGRVVYAAPFDARVSALTSSSYGHRSRN